MARRTTFIPKGPIPVERCDASGGKIIYPSAPVAESAARQAYYDHGADVRPYQDPRCAHWHLTKNARD